MVSRGWKVRKNKSLRVERSDHSFDCRHRLIYAVRHFESSNPFRIMLSAIIRSLGMETLDCKWEDMSL